MSLELRRFQHCPACRSIADRSKVLFATTLFGIPCDILKCDECGLIYKGQYPDRRGLDGIYSTEYVHFSSPQPAAPADVNSARLKLQRCQRLLEGARKGTAQIRLLDLGCGAGQFVQIARTFGYDAEGIDPYLPDNLAGGGLSRRLPEQLPVESYDIVALLNVAEHLVNPLSLFTSIRRLLRPGGMVLVTCPYGDSLARRFYKDRWTHLALDEHLLFWTPGSLKRALRRSGFAGKSSVRIAGSPFPYGLSRTEAPDAVPVPDKNGTCHSVSKLSLQQRAWRLARQIQAHEKLGNAVRRLIHVTRLGDYLEYVARVSN